MRYKIQHNIKFEAYNNQEATANNVKNYMVLIDPTATML